MCFVQPADVSVQIYLLRDISSNMYIYMYVFAMLSRLVFAVVVGGDGNAEDAGADVNNPGDCCFAAHLGSAGAITNASTWVRA